MKRILISLILLSVLVVLPAYGTEIVNGVEQGLGGDTYDGTGVDTIVAGTSIAVPSGFTATTAGAQASELSVTTLRATGNTYANTITVDTNDTIVLGPNADIHLPYNQDTGTPNKIYFGTLHGNAYIGEFGAGQLGVGSGGAAYVATPSDFRVWLGDGAALKYATQTATVPGFINKDEGTSGLSVLTGTVHLIATSETVYTATTTATSIGNAYSVNVDSTNHALVIDQYGQVGQDPCSIEAKADLGTITDEQVAALFDQLRPFIGEYRKREPVFETKTVTDEDGKEKQVTSQTGWKYIEEGSGVIEPMMYATEMPLLNGKRLPYKDRVIIAILAAKIRVMEQTQASILNRLEKLEAK